MANPNLLLFPSTVVASVGSGPIMRSYQLTYLDLTTNTSGSGAKTFNIDTLGQGSALVYVRLKHSVAFAGGGLTDMKIRLGKLSGTTNFFAADFDIFQAVADGTLEEVYSPGGGMGQLSAVTLTLTVTPTGDNCSAATAGVVNVDVMMWNVSTPTFIGAFTSGQVL